MVMLHAWALGGRLGLVGTLNLEGETIPDGELTPGGWGEGFNDRRHPHTYVHELMLPGSDLLGRLDGPTRVSLAAGKGFVPFGSDDPMSRPVFRYPVNHHLAQMLERAVLIAGVRSGPVLLEGSLFNGDEPERPGQWPLLDRFGDSWSARLTLLPAAGVELSGSRAKVHSPEHRPGRGYRRVEMARLRPGWSGRWPVAQDTCCWSGRAPRRRRGSSSSGACWERRAIARGPHRPYYRFEQTDRPEDMRELDLFRSVRPHLENSILGTTRFTLHTFGYGVEAAALNGRLALQPFVEATLGSARGIDGGVLTPEILYGTARVRALSVGLRAGWGTGGHRMGRYGGLLGTSAAQGHDHRRM